MHAYAAVYVSLPQKENGVRRFHVCCAVPRAGLVTFTSVVYIENVDRAVGTSLQLMAETDVENATVGFRLVEVTDGQGRFVSLNSSGYLTIAPGANVTFFIDVSMYTPRLLYTVHWE